MGEGGVEKRKTIILFLFRRFPVFLSPLLCRSVKLVKNFLIFTFTFMRPRNFSSVALNFYKLCKNNYSKFNFCKQGRVCEEKLEQCEDSPCLNGALCLIEDDSFRCYCVPDYHGKRCQHKYNECQLPPGNEKLINNLSGWDLKRLINFL